jgi:aminoglycoside phosphotransferase (APT) family kinase protein
VETEEFSLADWHDEARQAAETLRDHLRADTWAMTTAFLEDPAPSAGTATRLVHNDLGAEHLFVTDHAITDSPDTGSPVTNGLADSPAGGGGLALSGVIDWSDAALGDPALDFAPLLRDAGPDFYRRALHRYVQRLPVDPGFDARVRFLARCKWIEDQVFALETGRPDFLIKGRETWSWLFPSA